MKPFELALKEYGIQEIVGAEHNPDVLKYFDYIGQGWVDDDETAWCAAFANYCLKKTNHLFLGKLNARSFLDLPNAVAKPALGDIIILWRISKNSPYGHVGFYITERDGFYYILGGNQNNQVCIQRYPTYRFLGYRRPLKNE